MNGMIQTRVTRQRTVILEELRKLTCHPTADELCDIVRRRLPHISLGTVYRNLDHLAEEGIVLRLDMAGKSKRYDGNIQPHQHGVCDECAARLAQTMPGNIKLRSNLADSHSDM